MHKYVLVLMQYRSSFFSGLIMAFLYLNQLGYLKNDAPIPTFTFSNLVLKLLTKLSQKLLPSTSLSILSHFLLRNLKNSSIILSTLDDNGSFMNNMSRYMRQSIQERTKCFNRPYHFSKWVKYRVF